MMRRTSKPAIRPANRGGGWGGRGVDCSEERIEKRKNQCASTELEHEDGLVRLPVKAIGERRCCWLVDDAQNLEASNPACDWQGRRGVDCRIDCSGIEQRLIRLTSPHPHLWWQSSDCR